MTVLTFLPRFAPLVKDWSKLRTIRKERKRPIKVGDRLSLRMWSARPYNSPQIVLQESVCTAVAPVTIAANGVTITPNNCGPVGFCGSAELDRFARLDGFTDWADMVAHFNKARGLPFEGVLIEWDAK